MIQKTGFGLKLRYYMQEFGPPSLTQVALSNALKNEFPETLYSQKYISHYSNGEEDPPMDFVEKCATLFKLDSKQTFELLVLALRSSKEIKIDCTKLTFIPEAIVKLLALILSEKVPALSDEECDKNNRDYYTSLLKRAVDGVVNDFVRKS